MRVIGIVILPLFFCGFAYGDVSPDFNRDGFCDVSDFLLFVDAFGTDNAHFDLNGDGSVNLRDYIIFTDNFDKVIVPYSGTESFVTLKIRNETWEVLVPMDIPLRQGYIAMTFDEVTIAGMPDMYRYSSIIYSTPLSFDFPFLFVVGDDRLCVGGDCSSFEPPVVVEEQKDEIVGDGIPTDPMYIFVGDNQWEPLFVSVIGDCSLGGLRDVSIKITGIEVSGRTATVYLEDLGMPRYIGSGYYDWSSTSVVGDMVVFVPPAGCRAIAKYPSWLGSKNILKGAAQ